MWTIEPVDESNFAPVSLPQETDRWAAPGSSGREGQTVGFQHSLHAAIGASLGALGREAARRKES